MIGLETMSVAAPMVSDPTKTQVSDCARVGQWWRSHNMAIARQETPTTTATIRACRVCGPSRLAISATGINPRAAIHTATRRDADACIPRAARTAVNQ